MGTLKSLMKKMMREGKPWNLAAGELNRAPRASRPSPAQMFIRRFCRSPYLPELPKVVTMEEVTTAEESRDKLRLDTAVASVKRQERPPLMVGQEVRMMDPVTKLWNKEGTVKAVRPSGRSYVIDAGDRLYKRNIKWLKPVPAEQVNFVSDGESSGELGEESACGADDKAASSSCSPPPCPPPRRRSCLAARAERLRWRQGVEVTPGSKRVMWASPLTTTFSLQTTAARPQDVSRRLGVHGYAS